MDRKTFFVRKAKFSVFIILCATIFNGSWLMMTPSHSEQLIKAPNVSGQFYEANPKRLSAEIDQYLKNADVKPVDHAVDVIIAPHAGYFYSGQVAAYSFKAVSNKRYSSIIVLAPSHYYSFDGISVWQKGGFKTPLGVANVDEEMAGKLINAQKEVVFNAQVFDREHSLEVEIPFIQKTFPDAKIVPVILGQPSYKVLEKFAANLNSIIGKRSDVLIVVSTDLSHYHDDDFARKMDRHTLEAVKQLKSAVIWRECQSRTMEMCGVVPVTAVLLYAKEKGLDKVDILKYANSSDVSGDKDRVVGYASILIYSDDSPDNDEGKETKKNQSDASSFTIEQKRRLIDIAKRTVQEYVATGKVLAFKEDDPRLKEEEGAFVTIHKHGALRGCIGNILGKGPLFKTVRDMAVSAAAKDPRFKPVSKQELKDIDLEVSVLSKPKVIKNTDEIKMGVHGVIVSKGYFNQGIFLPQVATETGWSKEEFMGQLCSQKAGLPWDCWKDPATKIEIFTAEVFSEEEVQ